MRLIVNKLSGKFCRDSQTTSVCKLSGGWQLSTKLSALFALISISGCLPISNNPIPGRDKQSIGTWYGAATGAAAGAVTGLNYTAAAGPGAWVGAGLGGLYGMFSGLGQDIIEEDQIQKKLEGRRLRESLLVQEILAKQFQKRMQIYPNRDIYPADLFFDGDAIKVRCESLPLVRGLVQLTKQRKPWSRIVLASYVSGDDADHGFAKYLAKSRAEELAMLFLRYGIDARRLSTKPMAIEGPLVSDPADSPMRYAQAVELILLD